MSEQRSLWWLSITRGGWDYVPELLWGVTNVFKCSKAWLTSLITHYQIENVNPKGNWTCICNDVRIKNTSLVLLLYFLLAVYFMLTLNWWIGWRVWNGHLGRALVLVWGSLSNQWLRLIYCMSFFYSKRLSSWETKNTHLNEGFLHREY